MKKTRDMKMGRRDFLGQASCAAVGSSALFSTLLNLRMAGAVAGAAGPDEPGDEEDYRALVCVFLAGGNDSFNMLVPSGDGLGEYGDYQAIRGDLALGVEDLTGISPITSDGKAYSVHSGMPEVVELFGDGNLAFVANVGTLVEPTTLAQYEAGSVGLPVGLYSHSDQIMHWQSSVPDRRSAVGWGGRLADVLGAANDAGPVSMNISLSGTNVFQSGDLVVPYSVSPTGNGSTGIGGYGQAGFLQEIRTAAVDSALDVEYQNLFERAWSRRVRGAQDAHEAFSAAVGGVPELTTVFSPTGLAQRLRMVARTIAARQALGMRRQTFFVMVGGWDHHDEVLENQGAMLPMVSAAMGEFYEATVEMGVEDLVTTFTASDFGRTLTSNGRGSDHAWGGNQMVMGGAVRGREIYGEYPDLIGSGLDTGRGRLIPTTSVDEYFAELACWFGVEEGQLPVVLPNVGRFWNGGAPVGFLLG